MPKSLAERAVYTLVVILAASAGAGRICSATPRLSSNDSSRWATVRALVDDGTYVIGRRSPGLGEIGIKTEPRWRSVDVVLNPDTGEFYSSKPPILATLVAGLYWLLKGVMGWTITGNPLAVCRTILIVTNLVPYVCFLHLLGRLLQRLAISAWAGVIVLATAAFATLMTPFLITLNNHTVATCAVFFAIYPVMGVLGVGSGGRGDGAMAKLAASPTGEGAFCVSGFFAGLAASCELPAAAFLLGLGACLLYVAPRRTMVCFAPMALIPIGAFFFTNYLAMGDLVPAYAKFGGPWYDYPGSYWQKPAEGAVKDGIDWAWMHENRWEYAFNMLFGHHGLFSLAPIWLLAAAGMGWQTVNAVRLTRSNRNCGPNPACGPSPTSPLAGGERGDRGVVDDKGAKLAASPTVSRSGEKGDGELLVIGVLGLVLTVVVFGFYCVASNNYGGLTGGLRWLMWLTPLWILSMVPVVEWLSRDRLGRFIVLALFAWSVFSVNYNIANPWQHPWLYDLLASEGYIFY